MFVVILVFTIQEIRTVRESKRRHDVCKNTKCSSCEMGER